MTLGDWLARATELLSPRLSAGELAEGRKGSGLEAAVLASHALGRSRAWVLAHPEAEAPSQLEEMLQRRLRGEPLAYITGRKGFFGREFLVDKRVLIPRPETETLVGAVLPLLKRDSRVLDVGTGSGCIAITLALESDCPDIAACDINSDALIIANRNARTLCADVRFVQCDCVNVFADSSFDVIVSNPPYVAAGDERLSPEVAAWEPHGALYAGNGLAFIERLVADAPRVLRRPGALAFEFGIGQGGDVRELTRTIGETRILKDLAGIERVAIVSV